MKAFFGMIFVLMLAAAFGPWVLTAAAVMCALAFVAWLCENADWSTNEEERALRRRHREEERHAKRMAAAQLEAQKKAQASATKNSLVGVATKIATGVAVNAITGGKHRHRH